MRPLLTRADETLLHQTPEPLSEAGVSDHRFFDRYWFEALDPDGEAALILGMGLYKNTNVIDAFAALQRDQRQINLRSSRRLRPHVDETRVGPISVEVLEPFQRLLLRVEPGHGPLACELEWSACFPAYTEARHVDRVEGGIIQDSTRYDQVGNVSGWIELEGARLPVRDWWGVRDHSWGVRSGVGGFEPARSANPLRSVSPTGSLLWIWCYLSTDAFACQFQQREDGDGNVLYRDGQLQTRLGGPTQEVAVTGLEHDISFVPGTRVYQRLRYTVQLADGRSLDVQAVPLVRPWAYRGTGYDGGFEDGRGLGAWRGDDVLESDVYDLQHAETVCDEAGHPIPAGHREQPVRVVVDGQPGFGHFPVMTVGALPRYGL